MHLDSLNCAGYRVVHITSSGTAARLAYEDGDDVDDLVDDYDNGDDGHDGDNDDDYGGYDDGDGDEGDIDRVIHGVL